MYTLLVTGDVPGASTYFNPLLQQTIIPCTSGTRPSSPVNGMMIHETDTRFYRVWNSTLTTWVIINTSAPLFAVKTNDTARNNSTVTADPQLIITNLPANTAYELRGILAYNGDALGDFKGGLYGPSGATFQGIHRGGAANATGTPSPVLIDATGLGSGYIFGGVGTGQNLGAEIQGIFRSGVGGTMGWQWAQSATFATATTLLTDSYIALTPLG